MQNLNEWLRTDGVGNKKELQQLFNKLSDLCTKDLTPLETAAVAVASALVYIARKQ